MKPTAQALLLVAVAALAGCSSAPKLPVANGSCYGIADNLANLRVGDELPRVMQVFGPPNQYYRKASTFGRGYDVLVYTVAETPCMKNLVNPRGPNLELVFNAQGQYVGQGENLRPRPARKGQFFLLDAAGVMAP